MRVDIYSLKRILFEGDAVSVNAKTKRGEITVLQNHEPLISMLEEGQVRVTRSADQRDDVGFEVRGGFLEVRPDHSVRLLVEE